MPRRARELSALDVRRLAHPNNDQTRSATFAVGGVPGLQMQISRTGSKSWIMRSIVGQKRREIGLGSYPEVLLADARDRAREARNMIRQGVDPVEHRKANRANLVAAQKRGLTFAAAMDKFLLVKLTEFENPKHKSQWRATLDTYAIPNIGDMLVADLGVADMLRVLEPIWYTKTETASRLRGRIEAVLAWATVHGHREGDNPARWKHNLDATLPKPSKISKVVHHPALALADAPKWFAEVRSRGGMATRALEFLAMTAARSGEVRGMTWREVDFNLRLWIVPSERMKTRTEHRVPLCDAAVLLLRNLDRAEDSIFAFSAARGGMLSDAALSACMKRIYKSSVAKYLDPRSDQPAVPHGLRSTFRDWCAESTEYPREMAEIALAHSVGSDVERAYRRSDMLEKRRSMMGAWAQFLGNETDGN